MFDVFDQDGGGSISVNEIQDLLRLKYSILFFFWTKCPRGLFDLSGHRIEREELEIVSKDIMETLDEDGDGDISKEEFIKHALKWKGFPGENNALIS